MLHPFRRPLARLAAWSFILPVVATCSASAQVTTLNRQLSRIDFSLNGMGNFRSDVAGTNYQDFQIKQATTNGLGGLITVRYTKSALLGAEFNYSFVRYSERYTSSGTPPASFQSPLNVQTRASEYTLGYVAHGPTLLGLRPFGAVGLGTTAFSPTKFAGSGLPTQARATYYYALGVDAPIITDRFGVRAQFRQQFLLAPDFGQNYLTIKQHTTSSQPAIGLYVRF